MKSRFINLIVIVGITLSGFGCAQAQDSTTGNQRNVSAAQVESLIANDKALVILDVRTPEEFAAGHVAGAENLNFYAPDFEQQLSRLDTAQTYLLYCASGNRSGKTALQMQTKGFKKVINSTAGFNELKQTQVPLN